MSASRWTRGRAGAVALGGVVGSACRWWVIELAGPSDFPWPVLVLNVTGSLLLGVLLAEESTHPRARVALHDLGAIGFCGGVTTFSTFAVEVVDLADRGDPGWAAAYGLASVIGCITAVVAGAAALRRARAIGLPLEEEP